MIERYEDPFIAQIWSKGGQFYLLCKAAGPCAFASGGDRLRSVVTDRVNDLIDDPLAVADWVRLEGELDHDMAAFVELVRDGLDDWAADRWHRNRTSSDLAETALALSLSESAVHIARKVEDLTVALANRAHQYRDTPVMGRTHGQFAEPTTIGRRFAVILHTIALIQVTVYNVTKLSGPVGTDNDRNRDEAALAVMGLESTPATQIVPRALLSRWLGDVVSYSASLSTLAMMIRLGSQPGGWCREVSPSADAAGSSSMAHKRNPIRSERAVGLSRLIRSHASVVIEAGAELWDERDISHSSVERVALADICHLLAFVTGDLAGVVERLEVHGGEVDVSRPTGEGVLNGALDLGISREVAYGLIRQHGPVTAAAMMKVEGHGRPYDWRTEPNLWGFVESIIVGDLETDAMQ